MNACASQLLQSICCLYKVWITQPVGQGQGQFMLPGTLIGMQVQAPLSLYWALGTITTQELVHLLAYRKHKVDVRSLLNLVVHLQVHKGHLHHTQLHLCISCSCHPVLPLPI
jgi:hypothetical protein